MAPRAWQQSRQRIAGIAALAAVGLASVRLLSSGASSFVSATPRSVLSSRLVSSPGRIARGAEEKKDDDGGFMKFLKVEQDIQLSPEEYKMALEQEVESQRRKYYINGVVKPNNLVVPWRPVDEKQLVKDARRTLKKNGIADPDGPSELEEEDSNVGVELIGGQDVALDWLGGTPADKVGYIVERKPTAATNFMEVATYEELENAYLLVQDYPGHEYKFTDQLVQPGQWTYRVLCRYRTGDVKVVDQQEVTVPEPEGGDERVNVALIFTWFAAAAAFGFLSDPGPEL